MMMCGGVKAVSRTAVWCQAPSELGNTLAMKYRTTLVAPIRPQKTTMRRTSSSWVIAWAIVRPLRTSQAHQPMVPTPTPTSSRISKLRQYRTNSGLDASMPADQANACIYRPRAMNRTENPTPARMQVRQPPHQSIAPYLRPVAARGTATDVVAIECFSFPACEVSACCDASRGGRALYVGLTNSSWQQHRPTFDATGVKLVQHVSGVFKWELLRR